LKEEAMSKPGYTRREAMKTLTAAGVGAVIGHTLGPDAAPAAASAQTNIASTRTRQLRIAHLTDIHVQPERRAGQGMIDCLHHVQSLHDKPSLILTGGDSIMDSFESDDVRTKLQWDLWRSALKNECGLQVKSCIGNHDVWGWNKAKSKTTGSEPNYGKKRAVEMLDLAERYYSFAQDGWRFIVLDSTQPDGGEGYRAFLDEPQLDWLGRELRATASKVPVCILSHIPIVAASAILWAKQDKRGDYTVTGDLIHQDAKALINLFAQHSSVKLCLSGHLHHVDRVDYNGVSYLCNGAVSGNWWKGRHKHCDEGYALIDLYDDGSFEHQYVKYGWKALQ
jgi:Icc protein